MKAGRELDARIAIEVMGWDGTEWSDSRRRPDYERLVEAGAFSGTYEEFIELQDIWSPSTDIAAAWQVVEHLKRTLDGNEWTGEFNLFYNGADYECWWSFSRKTEKPKKRSMRHRKNLAWPTPLPSPSASLRSKHRLIPIDLNEQLTPVE